MSNHLPRYNVPSDTSHWSNLPTPVLTQEQVIAIVSIMLTVATTSIVALLLLLILRCYQYVRSGRSVRYPPGPPGSFVIGNVRQMPSSYPWLTFNEWGKKYGPLTYVKIFGKRMVIINSQKAAIDLLEKRASNYSDRPDFNMIRLSGLGDATAFLRAGPAIKSHRKLLAQALHPRIVQRDYVPLQERSTRRFAVSLLDDPDNFVDHIHRLTGETVQAITYGESYDGDEDLVKLGTKTMRNVGRVIRGYYVDVLPWLKYLPEWFPGAQFQHDAKSVKAAIQYSRWLPYDIVKRQAASGLASPSLVLSALEGRGSSKNGDFDDGIISATAMTLFAAGGDTVAGTLRIFMLAMLLHPEVQARARAELDRVVGRDRLPTIASRDATPYLNAVLLETLRWHPILPTGVPHRASRDDTYEGYFIPAGTTIMVNCWGILHDERHFTNPFTFDPDRYLDFYGSGDRRTGDGEKVESDILDPWDVAFGYGRRICLGIPVARTGLWIAMATIIACFEIKPRIDPETKKPTVTRASWMGTSTSFPEPFACDIVPRSQEWAVRIREAAAEDTKTIKIEKQ